MNSTEYLATLRTTLDEFRFDEVDPLTDKIDASVFKPKQAIQALGMLRRKRLFPQLEKTACLFEFAGVETPVLRRQWAQALLDQNRVRQALTALKAMKKNVAKDPKEKSEVQGLIGRAYKQLYINEGDEENLVQAVKAYRTGWRSKQGDYRWHGINLAALLARAEQDGIDLGVKEQAPKVAKKLLAEIDGLGEEAGYWDHATAMEAAIALGDEEAALDSVKKYVNDPGTDAFELASTMRQMQEVWRLDETELGKKIMPVLEGELLWREGGTLQVRETATPDPVVFEAVYGSESSIHLEWINTMYQRCLAVGRVFNTATGTRYGSGFLARGSALRSDWGAEPVFVTNSHVLSPNPEDEARLGPGNGSVEFTKLASRPAVKLGKVLFTSPKKELDVTIMRIVPPTGTETLEPSFSRPAIPKTEDKEPPRVYVIGHPQVGELSVTLYDNRLVKYEDPYVLYRSPTERGSSGSPVFDPEWNLFALHHTAKGWLRANEGVLLGPISKAASKQTVSD